MNKKNIFALVLGTSLVSGSVFAASDNTITFQGEVTDETCSVAVNGNSASPVVLLPTVSASDLLPAAIRRDRSRLISG
jgi:major type 1 subunit fimbrin (pilin)